MKTADQGTEWPTLFVMVFTYLVLGVSTTCLATLSLPVAIVVTGIAIAQFSSLQHEVLHGHPFRNQALNEAFVFPAVTLFIPYIRFKDTHLDHHRDPMLTDPYDDPESNFLDPAVWDPLPTILKSLLKANNTLFGRIVFGPAVSLWPFLVKDLRDMLSGNSHVQWAWMLHALGLILVLTWIGATQGMPIWAYGLSAYLGFGLLKIRTFLEHRAHDLARARSVIIEDRGLLALLFLNNNFHAVHHCQPNVAWYRLPRLFAQNRDLYLARNDGYFYTTYREVFKKYFFHAKDTVAHPIWKPSDRP